MPGDRRALAVTAFIQHITVSVRADDGARVDSNSVADLEISHR